MCLARFLQVSLVSSCLLRYRAVQVVVQVRPFGRPCLVSWPVVPEGLVWPSRRRRLPYRLLPGWGLVARPVVLVGERVWELVLLVLQGTPPGPSLGWMSLGSCRATSLGTLDNAVMIVQGNLPFPSLDMTWTMSPACTDSSLVWALVKSYRTLAIGFFGAGGAAGGGGGGAFTEPVESVRA